MAFERVLLACHGGDAALCVVRIRLGPTFLCYNRNSSGVRHLERKRKPSDTAAQY